MSLACVFESAAQEASGVSNGIDRVSNRWGSSCLHIYKEGWGQTHPSFFYLDCAL